MGSNSSITKVSQRSDVEIRLVVFSLRQNRLSVHLVNALAPDEWELPVAGLSATLSLEETAHECLQKYIQRPEVYLEQLYTYGDPVRGAPSPVVSIVYFVLIPTDACQERNPTSLKADWLPVENLPQLYMDHAEIIEYAVRRLRYKLEYSAVGFELLPEYFSLSELQHTYEMILGEKLDKRNFRRRMLGAGIIESTPHRRTGEGRPAQLFRYRPDAVAEVKARRLFP